MASNSHLNTLHCFCLADCVHQHQHSSPGKISIVHLVNGKKWAIGLMLAKKKRAMGLMLTMQGEYITGKHFSLLYQQHIKALGCLSKPGKWGEYITGKHFSLEYITVALLPAIMLHYGYLQWYCPVFYCNASYHTLVKCQHYAAAHQSTALHSIAQHCTKLHNIALNCTGLH